MKQEGRKDDRHLMLANFSDNSGLHFLSNSFTEESASKTTIRLTLTIIVGIHELQCWNRLPGRI